MSLLLWEYHLDSTEWFPAVVVTPAAVVATSGGSGRSRYTSPDPDFWLVRERYLRRHFPEISTQTAQTTQTADAATVAVANADSKAALRSAVFQYRKLILDKNQVFDDYYHRAATVLLLDLF